MRHPIDILGLDPSLSATGVAHMRAIPGSAQLELMRWTTITPRPRSLTGERACYSQADGLQLWLDQWGIRPAWVFRESVPPGIPGRNKGRQTRSFLDGMLCRVIQQRAVGLEVNPLNVSEWRRLLGIKTAGLKGPALKARLVEHAVARWDVEFGTSDAAEAALIALAGWQEIEEEAQREEA